ncbi:MAG: response regulator transcription factor [Archangiaceae bacterium]|nr:response regulator transcription factor [Archangiaceae bacterium]
MRGLPVRAVPLRVLVSGSEQLTESLSMRPDVALVSRAEAGLDVSARAARADVIVVDTTVGTAFAHEAIRSLTVETPVLALTATDDGLPAIAAGASGSLHRDTPAELVLAAISALHQGLAVFDRSFVTRLVPTAPAEAHPHPAAAEAAPEAREELTPREQEVLALLAEGLSNKEIASRLDISDHTAKFHVNSILQKMGAQKRVEAVVRAARLGIIDL